MKGAGHGNGRAVSDQIGFDLRETTHLALQVLPKNKVIAREPILFPHFEVLPHLVSTALSPPDTLPAAEIVDFQLALVVAVSVRLADLLATGDRAAHQRGEAGE